ncbi:DUF3718 domain-containing protein [Neiella marina]|uniref:DUF3718 domain-containing protein n=1 Tax=Neiella holothuriorum TaxID=2870530 RepID=A0ABS7EF91_9GAMM|nr:DUF3718 domain-containing protein [Neiella holothuriorum]MBW8191014.1 DUF3718 domain-containing protein [Neiella holothuriorum]
MNKVCLTVAAAAIGLSSAATSTAAMDSYVENALIDICRTSQLDRVHKFKRTVASYRLKMNTVANNVVCNGDDIGTFAAEAGAVNTANFIRNRQTGHVEVRDLANKLAVTVPQA